MATRRRRKSSGLRYVAWWVWLAGGIVVAAVIVVVLVLILGKGSDGSGGLPPLLTTKVEKLLTAPSDYEGKQVTVSGAVERPLYLEGLNVSYVLLDDSTGEIWYRESGNYAASLQVGEQVKIAGSALRSLWVPDVGEVVVGVVKYDAVDTIVSMAGSYAQRLLMIAGEVIQVEQVEAEPWTYVLVEDGTGQLWVRLPRTSTNQGERQVVEGVARLDLEVPRVGWVPVLLVAADDIRQVTDDAAQYESQYVLVKGTVKEVWKVPLVDKTFVHLADSSGDIWCRSEQMDLEKGDTTMLWGDVLLAFTVGDRVFGTMIIER